MPTKVSEKESCIDDSSFLPSEFYEAEEHPIAGRKTLWIWGLLVYASIGGYAVNQFWKEYNIETNTQTTVIEATPESGQSCKPLSVTAAVGEVPLGLQEKVVLSGVDYPSIDGILSTGDSLTRTAYHVSSTKETCWNSLNNIQGDESLEYEESTDMLIAAEIDSYFAEFMKYAVCTNTIVDPLSGLDVASQYLQVPAMTKTDAAGQSYTVQPVLKAVINLNLESREYVWVAESDNAGWNNVVVDGRNNFGYVKQFLLEKNSFTVTLGEKGRLISNGGSSCALDPLEIASNLFLRQTCDLVQDGSGPFICISTKTTHKTISEAKV